MPENPWITNASRLIYENPWIRVCEDQVTRPDGKPGIYGVVHFKNRAVGVIPVEEDGSIWLVGQHRYPLGQYSWEIPEGGCPEGESPEECAFRELQEETGLVAASLEPLITAHLSNSVSDEWGIVFRATELDRGPSRPDGCERLEVRRMPFEEALFMLQHGEITDSLSVIGLLHEALRRARGHSPPRCLSLSALATSLAIVRLEPGATIPSWASSGALWSVTRTNDELSLVIAASSLSKAVSASVPWRAFRVDGPLDLRETGILLSIVNPLSAAQIPVFAVSTFMTDYVLVREAEFESACRVLQKAGHRLNVTGG